MMLMKKPIQRTNRRSKRPGFALVVTLSLMILLTVVAVGMLTLATISLRSGTRTAAMAEARQNARLALMVALGELQKYAGQDQRITAIADMGGDASGDALAAGAQPLNNMSINDEPKGLSSVQPGTRYWTGVWRNSDTTNTAGSSILTKTPSPSFMQWLISGNETGGNGTVTPASPEYSVGSNGTVSNPKSAVVLVGRMTAGEPSAESLARYVAAPLVPITAKRGNQMETTGRYGWWIGDEGVKATINSSKTNNDVDSYASLSPQRRGWDAVTGFSAYPSPDSGGNGQLPKIISLEEASLLLPSIDNNNGGTTPLQSVFHSATTDSKGLITDTLNGGTKVDLTTILAGNLPTANTVSSILSNPVKGENIIPALPRSSMVAPKWDTLQEFYKRHQSLSGGALTVTAATSANTASIAPLITDLRLLMGVKFSLPRGGTDYKFNACGKFAVAIANPYSVPLKWNNDLEFEVINLTPAGNYPSRIWVLGGNSVYIPATPSEPAVFNQTIFRIRPGTLQPGEAQAFTVASAYLRPIGSGTRRFEVDLGPFGSSSPRDFSKCVELDAIGVYKSFPYALDVRESWQTSLIGVEMRLAGGGRSAQPLRRIEGFELDNGYFLSNIRNVANAAYCSQRTRPIPLMGYNFQISRTGVDYVREGLLPSGYSMGQRGSTLRTFADFNLQATRISKPITSYNPPPFFAESSNSISLLPDGAPGGDTGPAFTKNLDSTMAWGRNYVGSDKTVLFSVPRQFTSLAQFQHADLTGDNFAASIGHQPGNAFANSYASPFVKRAQVIQRRVDYVLKGSTSLTGTNQTNRDYYDISYLLNATLWDSYFLSTVRDSGGTSTPENPSLLVLNPSTSASDLRDPVRCASRLMINGAFNINSTDKNAWKAFLGSSKHFKHKADGGALTGAAFPRSLDQPNSSANPPTGNDLDSYAGYRRLTDDELDNLAAEMVRQVRLRGPFVSLSHFVNRALGDITRFPALTRYGALQAAIDESGTTINFEGTVNALRGVNSRSDRLSLSEKGGAPMADMDGGKSGTQPSDTEDRKPVWATSSADQNYGSVASIYADRTMLSRHQKEQGYRSTGIPGWLTQADVLQAIGPSITNRSDTFRIRAYGESLDSSGNTLAKTYCEAIVQRLPNYVDPSNTPSQRGGELSNLNQTYGRQFSIISFRWLSPQEI